MSIGFGVFTFPEEYLCSDSSGDVSSISYEVNSTPVTSTTTSDPVFLSNSVQSPGVPLVNIDNEIGSGSVDLNIQCTKGKSVISQMIKIKFKDNNTPVFNSKSISNSIFFTERSFTIQLAGILSDYNVPQREAITNFKAYLSTNPKSYTSTPSYIDNSFVNLAADYSATFGFSYTQGAIGT